ncbi:hypothetical protein [uncultured Friedmanniella sp.]|uniref:hypothetical protein n=1 Tax=uncultured Friedmanniella sp. TaxID=335381 RepID=UPI0035CAA43F
MTTAVQQRRTRPARLAAALELRARHPRRRQLKQLLGDVEAGAESSLEINYLREDNRFVLAAVATLRYGWFDVLDHPCLVAAQVAAALRALGWSGLLGRCNRCLAASEADLWLPA